MTESFHSLAGRVPERGLGPTTLRVGTIGLGCMGLTGVYDVEHRDEAQSIGAVHRALELGMTYLDTSDAFGPYGNEKLLGRALVDRPGQAVISSKVGLTGRIEGTTHHNAHPKHIHDSIDETLRRLGVECLDVYQLQAVDPEVPVVDSWGAMAELVAAGKVRTLGIMTDDTRLLTEIQRVFPVSVVTAELSYWEQGNLPLAKWAADRGITLAASSPLGRGFLTATLLSGRPFPWTDLRSKLPQFKPEALRAAHGVLEPLRAVALKHGARPGQVALAWLFAQSPSILPIPGSKNPEHVAENAMSAHLRLTEEDLGLLSGDLVIGRDHGE